MRLAGPKTAEDVVDVGGVAVGADRGWRTSTSELKATLRPPAVDWGSRTSSRCGNVDGDGWEDSGGRVDGGRGERGVGDEDGDPELTALKWRPTALTRVGFRGDRRLGRTPEGFFGVTAATEVVPSPTGLFMAHGVCYIYI